MKKTLLIPILILQFFGGIKAYSQSFTVDDLINLASLQPKNIDHFMDKNGFAVKSSNSESAVTKISFRVKIKGNKNYTGPERTVDIYLSDDLKYFTLHTSALNEYIDGKQRLIKSGFFYDDKKDVSGEHSMLFQKGNVTIEANSVEEDGIPKYNFEVKVKRIPSTIKYAEDLLQFDSHEFLVSYFGTKNVTKDIYYFSEKELRKCSVLFSGTRYQVVFVWENENDLNNISYILIPRILPTAGAERNNISTENNEWKFENGIHPGMALKELLRLNEMNFDIYGNASELAFMVKPEESGRIDFKKTAVTLHCNGCNDIKMFDQKVVSALDVAKKNLPMYVDDVILYPSRH